MVDRHYPHAPITEAVIDVQVEFNKVPDTSALRSFAASLREQFPLASPVHVMEIRVADALGDAPAGLKPGQTEVGLRLSSAKGDRVLQLQRRGFTYSHLRPYSNWAAFSGEARAIWDSFVTHLSPAMVTRTAVRYINRIEIPETKIELGKYFQLYPKLPEGVPQDITSCFMQAVIPQSDISENATAILNFAVEPNPAPGAIAFLLDFDVFSSCRVPPGSEDIWVTLGQLRLRKNKLFEACITDATRERFK
ncbi:TIGR04255 family protein [Ralstonia pseudosolanacearum]|uniref:TIGR04255 family protein n=1 Tax=Ralstonia pseudosolanacearum TaxID=1310165 RepID=UPI0018D03117|nr:TIGR04255 family protein [Ralstonia pseudosolanacearum]